MNNLKTIVDGNVNETVNEIRLTLKPGVKKTSVFIRESGLIPRGSAPAQLTQYLRKFGIKPDSIINFLTTEPPFKQRRS